MNIRKVSLVFALSISSFSISSFSISSPALAQDDAPAITLEETSREGEAEEIVVIGQRQKFQLRQQVLDAERQAYETFNRFNDEKRFEISCSMHARVGSRLKEQVCQPAFKREALANEGRDYLFAFQSLQEVMVTASSPASLGDPSSQTYTPPSATLPAAQVIAAQQEEYQRKMKQVAEEHPEFLQALVEYTELKNQYDKANSLGE